MKKKFLFIVTFGRSGSTLLMGILNNIPGFCIRGENHNAFPFLMEFHNSMLNSLNGNEACEKNFGLVGSTNPWWNCFDEKKLSDNIRNIIVDVLDPDDKYRVVGFKEIRYPHLKTNLSVFLSWLWNITDCRFIFLTRNLEDVCKSEWWANNPIGCNKLLSDFVNQIQVHIDMYPEQDWFHVSYEDIRRNNLEGLFDFLGEKFDRGEVERVLGVKHGYKTNGEVKCGLLTC